MSQTSTAAYGIWHETLSDSRFSASSAALRDYLTIMEGTESPTPFHIWSFISLVAALCGDSFHIEHGTVGMERLNLGIILTGVPAIRKSSAMTLMQKFAEGLPIQYGPTDTAGQRQGIMSAMLPRWQRDIPDETPTEIAVSALEELARLTTDDVLPALPLGVNRKPSEIYFVSKELGRLVSSNSRELFDFFTDGMDGETFHYQLKNQVIRIKNPLINLIGATTPASLGHLCPRGGESHGFLSRLIFVHAPTVSAAIPLPDGWNPLQLQKRDQLHALLTDQLGAVDRVLRLSKAAKQTYADLYAYQPSTADVRLHAYKGRRAGHMLRVAGVLALLRGTAPIEIIASDIRLAHTLLLLTESTMDRAFYGLDVSPQSRFLCAFAELAESSEDGWVSHAEIRTHISHAGEVEQVNRYLLSFVELGKIKQTSHRNEIRYTLDGEQQQLAETQARMQFTAGGVCGSDEFRTHKFGVRLLNTKKGEAG